MGKTALQNMKLPKLPLKQWIGITTILIFLIYALAIVDISFYEKLTLVGFLFLGAASRLPERFSPVSLGIELISVFTVVTAISHGFITGALLGSSAFLIAGSFTLDNPQDTLAAMIGFVGVAYFAPLAYAFFGANLGYTAIALTLGYDVFTGVFYYFVGYNIFSLIRFSITHLVANYFIISYLGAKLLGT